MDDGRMDNEQQFRSYNEADLAEQGFQFPELIDTPYFVELREEFLGARKHGFRPGVRNYCTLLRSLQKVHVYNAQHASSFAKRFRNEQNNTNCCHAIYAELLVYAHYIPLVYEGVIQGIELEGREADVILLRPDGGRVFMEVFCITPKIEYDERKISAVSIQTHTKEAMSGVRQKLLKKIEKQGQFSKPRENYAVIELNHHSIANNFTVPASLSDGYKVQIDTVTRKAVDEGYDWSDSVFELPGTKWLKGVIWFSLGDYANRNLLLNPKFQKS